MSEQPKVSRRAMIGAAVGVSAGVAGATLLAKSNGLTPPEWHGVYGPGDTMTFAAQRMLLGKQTLAREFSRERISKKPFANQIAPPNDAFKQMQAGGFADWRVAIGGMVARPASLSLADIRGKFPASSQITQVACEEGWSYIAEWTGARLSQVLEAAGIDAKAKYVVYSSFHDGWVDSIDMADALHPQTLLTYGMNGGELPVGFGGPVRMRAPRQLGYKSVKFIARLHVTDSVKDLPPAGSYSWYAGI